jgi:UDP-2,4-diacetamido-2,4,6-trideoxy-beta-L-altropyranose hydrolase
LGQIDNRSLAVFRFDAGVRLGGGHAVRCSALAEALERRGWRCGFAIGLGGTAAIPALARSGKDVIELGASEVDGGTSEAAALRRHWPDGCALLVVDHYGLDAAFESACRPWAASILVIDDLADRRHDCDLLSNAAPGCAASDYHAYVPDHCRLFVGSTYALLREEFWAHRSTVLPRRIAPRATKLLISFGASDPDNLSATAIDAAAKVELTSGLDVILGAASPHRATIESQVSDLGGRVLVNIKDMTAPIAEADLAVGAGGLSALERCCLGLPTLLLPIADNQRRNIEGLANAGAAGTLDPPLTAPRIADALSALAEDQSARTAMSTAGTVLCDGLGAARLAMAATPDRCARDGLAVTLRSVTRDDCDTILDWQRHPATRRFSPNPTLPTELEHSTWLAAKLGDPGCVFNMILHGEQTAGVVRLDRLATGDGYEVSINVDPEHQGKGIASIALALIRELVSEARFLARIHPSNTASLTLFENAGYRPGDDEGWYVLSAISTDGELDRSARA